MAINPRVHQLLADQDYALRQQLKKASTAALGFCGGFCGMATGSAIGIIIFEDQAALSFGLFIVAIPAAAASFFIRRRIEAIINNYAALESIRKLAQRPEPITEPFTVEARTRQ